MTAALVPVTPTYSTDANEAYADIINTGQFALDLETTGLDAHKGQIGLVIIESNRNLYLLRDVPPWMRTVLEHEGTKKLIFNAKFDLQWLFKETGATFARGVEDLYLKELMVSTVRHGVKHDLQATLERRLGIKVAKDVDHSQVDWTGPLTEQMIGYALEDIAYLRDLNDELDRLIEATDQGRAMRIENDAVPAVAMMTLNGVPIDREAWEGALIQWTEEAARCAEELDILIPGVKNWNSTQQIHKAVLDHFDINLIGVNKKGELKPSTAEPVIKAFADACPALRKLLEYRGWAKRLSSWGSEYLSTKVCPECNRIRPSWNQMGADTGRFSCSAPNLQQIPRDKKVRALFRARPGHVIASIDYKAIEVLVAGVIAQDARMIEAVASGDPHTWLATMILGKAADEVTELDRQIAKSANFHLIFFGGWQGLIEYARNTYEIELTEKESQRIMSLYFNTFTGLAMEKALVVARVNAARDRGDPEIHCRNMVGMRRVLLKNMGKMKPTNYMNTRVQSTAGYGIKAAMRRLGEFDLTRYLIMQVHDELVFEFPADEAAELTEIARLCMVAGMKDVIGRQVPVLAEPSIGEVWS